MFCGFDLFHCLCNEKLNIRDCFCFKHKYIKHCLCNVLLYRLKCGHQTKWWFLPHSMAKTMLWKIAWTCSCLAKESCHSALDVHQAAVNCKMQLLCDLGFLSQFTFVYQTSIPIQMLWSLQWICISILIFNTLEDKKAFDTILIFCWFPATYLPDVIAKSSAIANEDYRINRSRSTVSYLMNTPMQFLMVLVSGDAVVRLIPTTRTRMLCSRTKVPRLSPFSSPLEELE